VGDKWGVRNNKARLSVLQRACLQTLQGSYKTEDQYIFLGNCMLRTRL
jgi:hypothetical protein